MQTLTILFLSTVTAINFTLTLIILFYRRNEKRLLELNKKQLNLNARLVEELRGRK